MPSALTHDPIRPGGDLYQQPDGGGQTSSDGLVRFISAVQAATLPIGNVTETQLYAVDTTNMLVGAKYLVSGISTEGDVIVRWNGDRWVAPGPVVIGNYHGDGGYTRIFENSTVNDPTRMAVLAPTLSPLFVDGKTKLRLTMKCSDVGAAAKTFGFSVGDLSGSALLPSINVAITTGTGGMLVPEIEFCGSTAYPKVWNQSFGSGSSTQALLVLPFDFAQPQRLLCWISGTTASTAIPTSESGSFDSVLIEKL